MCLPEQRHGMNVIEQRRSLEDRLRKTLELRHEAWLRAVNDPLAKHMFVRILEDFTDLVIRDRYPYMDNDDYGSNSGDPQSGSSSS